MSGYLNGSQLLVTTSYRINGVNYRWRRNNVFKQNSVKQKLK